jgi:hypothetical protein
MKEGSEWSRSHSHVTHESPAPPKACMRQGTFEPPYNRSSMCLRVHSSSPVSHTTGSQGNNTMDALMNNTKRKELGAIFNFK